MPDITMCKGTGCPMRGYCRRSTEVSRPESRWQSWFAEVPVKPDGTCPEFVEARPEDYDRDYIVEDP